ncbi:MAG: sensor histidine kinase [Flavobacteriales bacterium]
MKEKSTSRILIYTMVAIVVIATYITVNSYYTQVAIYQEKELFKLDCIANAVAYKISGDEHSRLISQFPSAQEYNQVMADSVYKVIHGQMTMAKVMTKVPSEMFTVVKAPEAEKYYQAISTEDHAWLLELNHGTKALDTMYSKGGMIGLYEAPDGYRLGAISPVRNSQGETVGVLAVEETFDSFINKAKDQIYFNILLSLAFILVIGVLMFFSVKSILKRLDRLNKEKQEVENMRKELVANVSHDLRTPLASIHGYIETLLMKKDSLDATTQEKYLNTTLQSTEKLKQLVDELFELSKIESRERKLNIESFSIKELAFDVMSHFNVTAQENGVELHVNAEGEVPAVKADLALIDRALQNLVSNGIKYCSKGDKVTIRLHRAGQKMLVTVSDTGSGISADELPHVFNRFFKGKTSKPGTGLGLAIVKSIMELHGTTCKVQSKEGEGTEFSFALDI